MRGGRGTFQCVVEPGWFWCVGEGSFRKGECLDRGSLGFYLVEHCQGMFGQWRNGYVCSWFLFVLRMGVLIDRIGGVEYQHGCGI